MNKTWLWQTLISLLMKQHLNTLYITQEGSHLELDGETVSVSLKGIRIARIPLHNLQAIQSFGWNISATPHLMAHCAQMGVNLSFCNPYGKLLCNVTGFMPGNVLLRRQQYRVADDPSKSLPIARAIVAAKILNARTVLQRALRDHVTPLYQEKLAPVVKELAGSVKRVHQAVTFAELLGMEGHAAEMYFSAFPMLVLPREFVFDARNRRPPRDPVNALLSFVYSLLALDCKSAAESVGLDSAVGLYHKDRPGRPGLALDLMEELRAPLADRLVLSLLNRRQLSPRDFLQDGAGGIRLTDDARRSVLKAWQERKSDILVHPFLNEKITIGLIASIQARLLALHIRGSLDAYPPFIWK